MTWIQRYQPALILFTFTFALAVIVRIYAKVRGITAHLSVCLCLLSVGVFNHMHACYYLNENKVLAALAKTIKGTFAYPC